MSKRIVAALLLSSLFAAPTVQAAAFVPLSSAYTSPLGPSSALALSGDGSTVVGYLNVPTQVTTFGVTYTQNVQTAYQWRVGSGVNLLPFDLATATSYDGSTVVGRNQRWTASGGSQTIPGLNGNVADIRGVSADGSVLVGSSNNSPLRWTASGGSQNLGTLPPYAAASATGYASGVSADGSVVVGYGNGGAWRWTAAGGVQPLTTVGPLGQPFLGQPNGISADGSTVVGQGGGSGAWIYTDAGGLNNLGISEAAYAASANGSVVVGGDENSSSGIAFVWDPTHGVRRLDTILANLGVDTTGWTLNAALDVSNAGTAVVGVGVNPQGQQEAFYANLAPVPAPAAIWLFGSGLVGLMSIARRKKN